MPNYTNSIWSETVPGRVHDALERATEGDVAVLGAGITGVTAGAPAKGRRLYRRPRGIAPRGQRRNRKDHGTHY
jgi:hypothetical protein